jgi:hypothetical protein
MLRKVTDHHRRDLVPYRQYLCQQQCPLLLGQAKDNKCGIACISFSWGDGYYNGSTNTHFDDTSEIRWLYLNQRGCSTSGQFTQTMPFPCRSPALPCRLEFRLCLSHLIYSAAVFDSYMPCRARAIPRPCSSKSEFSRPQHSATWAQHGHGMACVN